MNNSKGLEIKCKDCIYLAKLINFGESLDNAVNVCTLFTDNRLSKEPIVCYTTLDDFCEMFTANGKTE